MISRSKVYFLLLLFYLFLFPTSDGLHVIHSSLSEAAQSAGSLTNEDQRRWLRLTSFELVQNFSGKFIYTGQSCAAIPKGFSVGTTPSSP